MDATLSGVLHGRFLRGLAKAPDGDAVRFAGGALTYSRLHERALAWAGSLGSARRVGVLSQKGETAYTAILAVLYAGATVVPLRPDFPVARLTQMIEAASLTHVIADDASAPLLRGLPVTVLTPESSLMGPALSAPRVPALSDAAYILFTSGSTGRPKGVVISHANTAHYFSLLDERYDFGPEDVFSQTFDLNFDCSLFDLFCAWGAGATLQVIPPPAYRELPTFLASAGVTVWFSTPSAIDLVRRTGGLADGVMPGLRWSFFAGEAFQCRDATAWQAAAPFSFVENLYGPTELTITVAAYRWSPVSSESMSVNGVVPIGEVHAGHAWVLEDEFGAGEGELCIAGPQLTPGYLDSADEAGRFFVRDGSRYYRTGDRVRLLASGDFAYLGRLDAQVQVAGWRVETAEIEHALRACGVADAVVVGVPGAAGTELVAYYTGPLREPVELVRGLRAHLPEGVIPRRYLHVTEFPLNGNRKIDRKSLAERAIG